MAFNGDPRKRPATKSPESDALAIQKRAPVAPMAPSKQDSHINTALSNFMNTSIALAKLDLKLDAAKEVLAAKKREYNNLLPQFAAFPAIKEEKTRAKTAAEQAVANLQLRMQQERTASQHVIAALGDVIGSKATAVPALSQDEKCSLGRVKFLHESALKCENRLDALESATGASSATTSGGADLSDLTARVDALEKNVDETQNETFETIDKMLNETLEKKDKEIASDLNALHTQLKALNDNLEAKDKINVAEFETLRTHITDSDKVQYQNAEAINDSLKRLGIVEAATEKASTAEGLATVEANVTALEERIKKVEAKKKFKSANDGEVAGMLKFQPVVYSESEDSSDSEAEKQPEKEKNGTKSANPKGMQLVKGEIERLKFMTRQHETRLNNLTTDEVVKQMGDIYSNLYPQARNFEGTANHLNGQLAQMSINLGSIIGDLTALTGQIDALSLRVDTHDKAVSDGQNGMTKLSGDIQQVSETVKQLISRFSKMNE
ncbi:hypothetical protein HII31_02934 [Pseudocercospora fuligena]|uniref:Uncharacterized protein n=1 Tax=Pseudocercospora fuligena TaxID=685502 RepID=A0A8H6RNJ2_9PEZI|nr:hypothetical protein HII31_02934 [Pseudocercospora fuligena]